jgi:AcrR family transcriptional regulator
MLTLSTPFCENDLVGRKKPRAAYHHGNLRTGLIDCGLRLIQSKGLGALTLREIGNRLGVSRSAAYRHFADKAALLAAISEAGFLAFGDALEAAKLAAAPDFTSRMQAMGVAYVKFANEHRAHFEVMFGDPSGHPSAAGERAFNILQNTIEEGQRSGDVRPGDPKLIARAVWAQIHGVSVLRLDTDPDAPNFPEFSFELLRTGLKPPGPETSAVRIPETPTRSADSPSAA